MDKKTAKGKIATNVDENEKSFKQKARFQALSTAQQLKPSGYGLGFNENSLKQPYYNILEEAEKIYQWLIKSV